MLRGYLGYLHGAYRSLHLPLLCLPIFFDVSLTTGLTAVCNRDCLLWLDCSRYARNYRDLSPRLLQKLACFRPRGGHHQSLIHDVLVLLHRWWRGHPSIDSCYLAYSLHPSELSCFGRLIYKLRLIVVVLKINDPALLKRGWGWRCK